MCRAVLIIVLGLGAGAERLAWARPLTEWYRGVRAISMGNAFTAISDDADAVFYNPAGLALQKSYELRLLNPKLDFTTDDVSMVSELRGAASKLDSSTVNALYGKHLYGGLSLFPSLVFPGFAIGYIAQASSQITTRNLAMPVVSMNFARDEGVVAGFGFEGRGLSKRHFLRVGASVKWLKRTGFDRELSLAQIVSASKATLDNMVGGPATGWGASLGFQYEMPFSRRDDIVLGAVWQDIGDTKFGNALMTNPPPSIRNNLAAGVAYIHKFSPNMHSNNNFKISGEMRHLAEGNRDPQLQMHFGGELALGMVSVQGGYSQDSVTFGAKVNVWMFEVAASSYGVENQSLAFMDRERRYMLQVTFKLDVAGGSKMSGRDEDRRKHPRNY